MLEALRKRPQELGGKFDTAVLALLALSVLQDKKKLTAEETFARRIEAAIDLKEIQFVARYPFDEPEEEIDWRLGKFKGFEDRGFIVFLVVKPKWARKALGDREQQEYLYGKLKATLLVIDEIRKQGNKVLNETEIEGIRAEQRV